MNDVVSMATGILWSDELLNKFGELCHSWRVLYKFSFIYCHFIQRGDVMWEPGCVRSEPRLLPNTAPMELCAGLLCT